MPEAADRDGAVGAACPACGRPDPGGYRFCGSCGAALPRSCPSCGRIAPPGFDFCGHCGASLAGASAPPDRVGAPSAAAASAGRVEPEPGSATPGATPERRIVTVLYADLVASTELATRLDPEELRSVLGPFFESMTAEVERWGGRVEKYIGDAIVAVFGYPVAHGDDAERAVRAALAMQGRLADDARAPGPGDRRLEMRVAVNTGEVIADSASQRGGAITGDAISVASRLQAVAPIGSVVVAERTRWAAPGLSYRALGDTVLKGVEGPIALWEARPRAEIEAEETGLRSATVGREGELAMLRVLLDRTRTSSAPALVTVMGPPGIGKSRLAGEFVASVEDVRVVRGRCLHYADGVAFWPLAEILKRDVGILDSDSAEVSHAKAMRRLESGVAEGADTATMVRVLLASIGIELDSDPLVSLESVAARRLIAAAWQHYFETLCREGPVVVVIEDIHWAETSLLELLESIASSATGPLLMLCLARPEVRELRPSWGVGVANASTLTLPPLSATDAAGLIEGLLQASVPPDIVDPVVERSEGNPFFVGELVRMMVDDGTLERTVVGWRVARPLPTTLPDTVQGVIAARIDLLSPAAKQAMQDASVVGRVFWPGVLARLNPTTTSAATDELIARGLVRERQTSAIAGEREHVFHHILTRDVAYASIPRVRRAAAHRTVLAWIEEVTSGREEEFAEILSHHAREASDTERTARYAMLAGYRHRRVFAAEEAIRWYDRASAALEALPSDRAALMRIETQLARGEACEQLGRYADAIAAYERALAVARARPTGSREWLEGRVLAALVQAHWAAGQSDEAERLLPNALATAADQGADDLIALLSSGAGSVALARGEVERAVTLQKRALAVAEAAEDAEGEAVARLGLAEAAVIAGSPAEGLEEARRAESLLGRLGQRPLTHRSQRHTGLLLWVTGQRDAAVECAVAAVAGSREVGSRRDLASALATLGWISLSAGRVGSALECLDEAAAIAEAIGTPASTAETCAWRVAVLAELGAIGRVAGDVSRALDGAGTIGGGLHHGPLLAARGWLEAAGAEPERASRSFDAAATVVQGTRLPAMFVGRIQLLAGALVASEPMARSAADLLAAASGEECPPLRAWSAYGAAVAARLGGDDGAAERAARLALGAALAAGEMPVAWRSGAILTEVLAATGRTAEADAVRGEAALVLRPMLAGIGDERTRALYTTQPGVADVLSASDRLRRT